MRFIPHLATFLLAAAMLLLPVSALPDLGYVLFKGGADESAVAALSSTAKQVSGTLELFVHVTLDDWTPASHQVIVGSNKGTIQLIAMKNGTLRLVLKQKGTTAKVASIEHNFQEARKWLHVSFDSDTGRVSFHHSDSLETHAANIFDWKELSTSTGTEGPIKSVKSFVLGRRREGDNKFALAGRMYGVKVILDGATLTEIDFTNTNDLTSSKPNYTVWGDWSLNGLKYVASDADSSPTTSPSSWPTRLPSPRPTRTPVTNAAKNNLIVILTDQQKYDTIQMVQEERGVPEQARISTPNLDRIAQEGAYFRNAYTHCAVCGPARASLLTGKNIENTGVRTNDVTKDASLPGSDAEYKLAALRTYDEILVEDHNYNAEYYGKWHTPNFKGYVYSNDVRLGSGPKAWFGKYNENGSKHLSVGMSEWYRMWLKEQPNATTAAFPLDDGDQVNSFSKYYYDPDPLDKSYGLETGTLLNVQQPDYHGMNRLEDGLSITAQQVSETIEALERLAKSDKPFSLHLSLHSPHAPMLPTRKYYEMYNPDDMEVPISLNDAMDNSAYAALRSQKPEGYDDPTKVKRWTADYFGLITEVDEWLGKILEKLDELGIAEKTLLAFSSDHGEMMGGHGMREKNNFYEESSHVPLLLRLPGTIPAGSVIDEPVSHLDLHSTFLDYTVGRSDYKTDGTTLRNNIEGVDVGDSFVVTMWNWTDARTGYKPSTAPAFMIRKGNWKLIISGQADNGNIDMLYNLVEDPAEMKNLIGKNGDSASDGIIGKAEHLKALLVKYLKESYHPDAEEIQRRRTWRMMDFWSGATSIHFRDTLSDGTRTEYLYLGTPSRTDVFLQLEGDHASRYGLKLDAQHGLDDDGFSVVAVRYSATDFVDTSSTNLVVKLDGGEEWRVSLNPPQNIQATSTSGADDDGFSDSLVLSLDLTEAPTRAPTKEPTAFPTITKTPTLSPTAFTSCSGPSEIGPTERLFADQEPHFICSPNGYYRFGMARDGDLSLWHGATKVWSARTCCAGSSAYMNMQKADGNLVVYSYVEEADSEDEEVMALWSSKTVGNPDAFLTIENDGRARIRAAGDPSNVLWETDIFI